MSVVIQVDRLSKQYRLGTIGGKRLVDDVNRWWARFRGKEDPLSKVGQPKAASRKQKAETPGDSASKSQISAFNFPVSALNSQSSALRPPSSDTIWALKDVSFEVKQGEVLGIIGRNGAGKSTLLKILSRITAPTSGEARVKGRIASLLEVGTGFNPELTGRENIFLNGAILGMTKAEIRSKFDEIVAFSEFEKFIDTPIKRYSSGMTVRLAFAVAAHLEPEILIVDEVLAVGDTAFQKKCIGKMKDVAGEGRTVIFVSHQMTAIEKICSRGICLQLGQIAYRGKTLQCIDQYLSSAALLQSQPLTTRRDRRGLGHVVFQHIEFLDDNNEKIISTAAGRYLKIRLHYHINRTQPLHNPRFSIGIKNRGHTMILLSSDIVLEDKWNLIDNNFVECHIERLPLTTALYSIDLFCEAGGNTQDWIEDVATLAVEGGDYYGTGTSMPGGWDGQVVLVDHKWTTR